MRTLITLVVVLAGCNDDIQGIPKEDGPVKVSSDALMPLPDGLVVRPDGLIAFDASVEKDAVQPPDGEMKDATIPQRDAKVDKPDVEQLQPDGPIVESDAALSQTDGIVQPDALLLFDATEEPDAAPTSDAVIPMADAEIPQLDAGQLQSDAGISPECEGGYEQCGDVCYRVGWSSTNIEGAPSERYLHTAVWTGSEMVIWGGIPTDEVEPPYLNTGGLYNPQTDTWNSTALEGAPFGRYGYHTAVWTGSEMIIWGGWDSQGPVAIGTNEGGRYNPPIDTWTPTSIEGAPSPRSGHTAIWTGSEMVVWGGLNYNPSTTTYTILGDGGRYNPETDTWVALTSEETSTARLLHSAVWTGSEMIVWGGFSDETGATPLTTGGKYNPPSNMWSATSSVEAPLLYDSALPIPAVWTGSEMVVWGGDSIGGMTNIGGRYNPVSDEWSATSLLDAPIPRRLHTAVWTDTELIVWGGSGGNTGGRYNPFTDMWIATDTVNAVAKSFHTAVWTGCEMIVWGGGNNTGGRYRP